MDTKNISRMNIISTTRCGTCSRKLRPDVPAIHIKRLTNAQGFDLYDSYICIACAYEALHPGAKDETD